VNGRLYTQDPRRPWAAGLTVREGRIERLLAEGEPPPAGLPRVDLGGRLVLPGFVDAHTHLTLYARNLDRVALGGVPSLAEALGRVREAAGRPAPDREADGWILGQGWDPQAWGGLPDRSALDAAAPGRLVALESRDCHAYWLSSAALERAAIDSATPDPSGGRIVRDAAGEPTGFVLEKATRLVTAVIPRAADGEASRLDRVLAEALSLGITGAHVLDAVEGLRKLEALDRAGRLPIRVVAYVAEKDLEGALDEGRRSGEREGRVRLGGLKLFTDGTLGSRTALLSEPYEGTGDFGIAIHGDAELAELVRGAAAGGLAVAIHAIGDRANTRALDALEAAPAVFHEGRHIPHRVEHAQLCFPADAARFGEAGIVASVQPCHIPGDWHAADRHWGDRCRFAYPFRTLLARGATLALGSDVPVEGWNPFRNLYTAVARRDWEGRPETGWHAREALTLPEALLAYTAGSAAASGEAHLRGRLAPGMDADLVALAGDLFALPPEAWPGVGCDLTVVGGEIVHVAGGLTAERD
jgi:predicted amidohydrolase YtcJ